MKFSHLVIESIVGEAPPNLLTSDEIERRLAPLYDRLRLPYGRLELMTGIRERRFWNRDTLPSEAGTLAARRLLDRSRISRSQLDMVIHGGVCRDRLEPATAAYIHRELGLPRHCQFMDVSNACLGFLSALVLAGGLIESRQARAALIVCGENGLPLIERTIDTLLAGQWTRQEIKPFFANLTIGSGAVAAIVCHDSLAPHGHRILGGIVETGTEHNRLCEGDSAATGGLEMMTDSEELMLAGIEVARRAWARFTAETGWSAETPDCILCHQVGSMHRRKIYEALGLDLAKDFSTFPMFGNIGSVSLPFTLAAALDEGRLRTGDKAALLGIGSGISSMMLALEAATEISSV